jgi:hypothetical protein
MSSACWPTLRICRSSSPISISNASDGRRTQPLDPQRERDSYTSVVSRYDTPHVDLYRSARKHGAIERDDGTEIVIHAMRMRRLYEPLLREMRGTND